MSHRWKMSIRVQLPCLVVLATLLACPAAVRAQDSSVALVPRDAAFYQSSLGWGEQWQTIVKSRAWAKLTTLPVVKMGWQKLEEEWGNPNGGLAPLRQFLDSDDNRALLRLLTQMTSEEIFVYGGRDAIDFGMLLADLQSANQFAPLAIMLKEGVEGAQRPEARIRYILQTLAQKPERIKAPDIVIGFKLSDTKLAENQLQRLETLLQALPLPPDLVKKVKLAGGKYLSLRLDGKLVPWELIPIRNFEENAGDFDALLKRLAALKLTINLGIRDRYLLLGLGESSALLEQFGKVPSLAEVPEMKPLAQFAERRLNGINYVSKETHTRLAPTKKDMEEMAQWAVDMLKNVGITDAQEARLRKDLKGLAAELYRMTPKPGASLALFYSTPTGQEVYSYDHSTNTGLDPTKPLTLLDHVGGSPLIFVCNRSKHDPRDYETFVKLLKLGHQYFEELALPKLPPEAQQPYEMAMKVARPLLVRLHNTTGKMLVPALADGQDALVIDAKLASKQWHKDMPAAAKPLPIPELALVFGVSDPALLRQAMEEYRQIANDAIEEIRKFVPGGPEFRIPEPETKKVAGGTLYFYPIPDNLGLDKRLLPTAGLGNRLAVITLSQNHATRLLTPMPLKTQGRPLARKDGVTSVAHMNWAGLVQAIQPWVEFGMDQGRPEDNVRDQVLTALKLLQVLRTYTSVTYVEDGVTITHSETVFRDLER